MNVYYNKKEARDERGYSLNVFAYLNDQGRLMTKVCAK